MASKTRDMSRGEVRDVASLREPVRPLNARSLALSALLGTHPPTLSAAALVALAELFGVNPGTMRTALSRMVAAGDVTASDGHYSLSPRLLARQRAQDVGRRLRSDGSDATTGWDGRWHTAVATVDQRDLADRRHLRTLMGNARFGELRPTVWVRPANLPPPDLGAEWLITTGPTTGTDPHDLVAHLWDLDSIASTAIELTGEMDAIARRVDLADPSSIPTMFSLSAVVLRFLRSEPLLPHELTPPDWPVDALRCRYTTFESDVQAMLRPFLRRR